MNESTEKLIQMLKKDYTIDFIKRELNLTNDQLAYRLYMLKYNGYNVEQKYYANGDITANLSTKIDYTGSCRKIYTKSEEDKIRFLVISDLHYFHEYENRKAIDSAFNYCVKNGIHIIFICGDLIDCFQNNITPINEQAELFTKLYPQDDGIINFCVLGNHDIKSVQYGGIDLKRLIESKRLDIAPTDYVNVDIQIKNGKVSLRHPIKKDKDYKNLKTANLTFIGHSHTAKSNGKEIYVPSLSNVKTTNLKNFGFIPQALDCTIHFNPKDHRFSSIVIDQLIITDEPYIINEQTIALNSKCPGKLNLEVDEYPSVKEKVKSL